MARSTLPIVLTAGMMFGNGVLLENKGWDWKILIAGGIAAGILAGVEQIPNMAPVAVGIAWLAFITAFIAPVSGHTSVAQNLINYTGIGKA